MKKCRRLNSLMNKKKSFHHLSQKMKMIIRRQVKEIHAQKVSKRRRKMKSLTLRIFRRVRASTIQKKKKKRFRLLGNTRRVRQEIKALRSLK